MSEVKTQIIPHLGIRDALGAIEFYKKAFHAEQVTLLTAPDGFVMHVEMAIDGAPFYITGELVEYGSHSPESLGGTPVSIHLKVADCDAVYNQAVEAGCTVVIPIADMFWGDRYGSVKDPYGHQWSIATPKKQPSPEELHEAMLASMAEHKAEAAG